MQVVAFAFEKWMLFNVQHDIQIAWRTAVSSGFAQAGKTNTGSVFNSRGNLGVHRPLSQYAAFTFALGARIGDHAARALTSRASTSHAEESLLIPNLAASSARSARDGCLAGRCTIAMAVFASRVVAN